MGGETPERCCFDDWVDRWSRHARKKGTVFGLTVPLLAALEEAGVRERSVLDLGCGIGDLGIETVRRGATSARGFDLSPKAIATARRLAVDRGVADRATFEVGDASELDLPPADVVVLNRVFCCYPNVDGLLERSLAAARSVYGFTMPRSRGLVGVAARIQGRIENWWMRRRPAKYGGFQVFIHDVDAVDVRVRSAGSGRFAGSTAAWRGSWPSTPASRRGTTRNATRLRSRAARTAPSASRPRPR